MNWIPERDQNGNPIFAPTFEDDMGLNGTWQGYKYLAQPNSLNIFDEPVTNELKLRGGWYELLDDPTNPTPGDNDYLEFAIVDKDDVLGLFGLYGLTPRTNEVQRVDFSATPTAGTYTLTYNGAETTSNINYDADASVVQTALNGLTSLSEVTVTGDNATGFVVTFTGADGYIDHPELTSNDSSLTGATISHSTTTVGYVGDILEPSKYVRKEYINKYHSGRQIFEVRGAADVMSGLFFRTYYNNTHLTNTITFKVVTHFHES